MVIRGDDFTALGPRDGLLAFEEDLAEVFLQAQTHLTTEPAAVQRGTGLVIEGQQAPGVGQHQLAAGVDHRPDGAQAQHRGAAEEVEEVGVHL